MKFRSRVSLTNGSTVTVFTPRCGSKSARVPSVMQNVRLDVRTQRRTLGGNLNTQEVRHDRNHSN